MIIGMTRLAVISTGGTIANKSGADGNNAQGIGVYLNNTRNVTLRRMTINGTNQNFGIRGIGVADFILENSTVGGINGTSTRSEARRTFSDTNDRLGGVSSTTTSNSAANGESSRRRVRCGLGLSLRSMSICR